MSLLNIRYLYSRNLNEIGNFKINFGNGNWPIENCSLFNVLQVNQITSENNGVEKFRIKTGVLNNNHNFFECPFKVGYVLFDSMFHSREFVPYSKDNTTISFKLELYSKNFKDTICINFEIEESNKHLPINVIEGPVNFLNLYIDNNNDIKDLDLDKLQERSYHQFSKSWYLDRINDLDFIFTNHSQNRVGKDNYFWATTKVLNLPEDKYTQELILDNLKFDDKASKGYSPSHPSYEFTNEEECRRLKRDLFNSTIDKFDPLKQLFERHKIRERQDEL